MIDIYEIELNLCDFRGTIQCDDMKSVFEHYSEKVKDIKDSKVQYVRLGYEFCENGLLHTNQEKLLKNMQWLYKQGLKIVFVLPPLHQRYIEVYQEFLRNLLQYDLINEIVINDMGAIYFVREKLGWNGKMTFGRLFDKSVREIRLNLSEYWNSNKSSGVAYIPSVMSSYQKALAKTWNIHSFETDTLPDDILDVEKWNNEYETHIHYPRLVLSKAAYCEYAQNDCQFEFGCKGACLKYGKTIVHKDRQMIYKEGLLIYGVQVKPLDDLIQGKIRLIYSEG